GPLVRGVHMSQPMRVGEFQPYLQIRIGPRVMCPPKERRRITPATATARTLQPHAVSPLYAGHTVSVTIGLERHPLKVQSNREIYLWIAREIEGLHEGHWGKLQ